MKIINSRPGVITSINDIAIGVVFTGSVGESVQGTFLRMWTGVVDLVDPRNVWTNNRAIVSNFIVRDAELRLL